MCHYCRAAAISVCRRGQRTFIFKKKWVIRLRRSSWRGNQQFKWEFRSVDFFLPSDYSLSTGYFSGIKAQQKWMYNVVCLGGRTWLTHHCWQPNTVAIPLSRDTWWVIELWALSFPLKGREQRGFYLKYLWKTHPSDAEQFEWWLVVEYQKIADDRNVQWNPEITSRLFIAVCGGIWRVAVKRNVV